MIYILLNIGPILLATLAGLAAGGALWRPRGRRYWITAALAEGWLTAILAGALILAPVSAGRWTVGLGSAAIIWIGFVAPALLVTGAYRSFPPRAAWGDAARWLTVMLIQAAVLLSIGLKPPPRAAVSAADQIGRAKS